MRSRSTTQAATLTRTVQRAARQRSRAVALEALLLAATAVLLTAAAALLAGHGPGEAGPWIAAALSGGAAGACWWLEKRHTEREIAARLDRSLDQNGALLTAWECERKPCRSPLEEWLVQRVQSEVAAPARRAPSARTSPALAALPLFAAAVWLGARESTLHERARVERLVVELARSLSRSSAAPAARARAETNGGIAQTQALAALDRSLQAVREQPFDAAPAQVAAVLDALERSGLLGEPSSAGGAGLSVRTARELARELARQPAIRAAVDARRHVSPIGPQVAGSIQDGPGGSPGFARDPGQPTMPPPEMTTAQPSSDASASGSSEAIGLGSTGAAWWPARYDRVVATYISARREAGGRAGSSER
jgi:hypothetical protein